MKKFIPFLFLLVGCSNNQEEVVVELPKTREVRIIQDTIKSVDIQDQYKLEDSFNSTNQY